MTFDEFIKNEYSASENSVPVNNELKSRMLKLADDCEKGNIPIALSQKHRGVRNDFIMRAASAITYYSTVAACFAVLALSVPSVVRIYDNNDGVISSVTVSPVSTAEPYADTEVVKADTEVVKADTEVVSENTLKSSTRARKAQRRSNVSTQTSTVSAPAVKSVPSGEIEPISEAVSEPRVLSERVGLQGEQEITGQEVTGTEQEVVGAEQEVGVGREVVEPVKAVYEPTEDLQSREALNNRLEKLNTQREKLIDWDGEISPYSDEDEIISEYYGEFSESRDKYENAAADFEGRYSGDDADASMGVSEYDDTLDDDSDLYNQCREAYRKSSNYIEMNDIVSETEE